MELIMYIEGNDYWRWMTQANRNWYTMGCLKQVRSAAVTEDPDSNWYNWG